MIGDVGSEYGSFVVRVARPLPRNDARSSSGTRLPMPRPTNKKSAEANTETKHRFDTRARAELPVAAFPGPFTCWHSAFHFVLSPAHFTRKGAVARATNPVNFRVSFAARALRNQ